MKRWELNSKFFDVLVVGMMASVLGIGCSSGSSGSDFSTTTTINGNAPGVPTVPTTSTGGTGAGGMTYSSGATATFTPDSFTVMSSYVGIHPLNSPTNYEINVALSSNGSGGYEGVVQLSYSDNGQTYNSYLTSGTGTVQVSDGYDGLPESYPNEWFTYNGKSVFHGFFQDQYGGVVLVVDQLNSNGDGSIATTVSGSLWFKNFAPQNCAQTPPLGYGCGQTQLKCWFIEIGPFDCQAFLNSSGRIDTTSAVYPGNGYTRLGTFTGLNYQAAF